MTSMRRHLDPDSLTNQLVAAGVLGQDAGNRVRRLAGETGERPDRLLVRLGLVDEAAMARALARLLGLPMVTAADYPAAPVCGETLAVRFLRRVKAIPLARHDTRLDLAMADPLDDDTVDAVALAAGCAVQPMVGLAADMDAVLDRWYGTAAADAGIADLLAGAGDEGGGGDGGDTDVGRLRDLASEAPIVRLVNQIIANAIDQRASDIHVEPFENELRIRYRIDGQLAEQAPVPRRAAAAIVSRLKLMAGLDIAERRLPQDGRIKLPVRGKDIDFRVAASPTLHGESIALRILDRSGISLDFAALGLASGPLAILNRLLDRPNGIILVTGPTGSGKTTTLYAALERLNLPTRKIITVEDPVEYQIHGINQIQVKPDIGLDFANVLRSTLRHDPDIIMIGEIRDLETARIAVQAALTGHLVLSTTHTNSAAATVTRLMDLGVADFLIAASLNAVIAQRLVRVLCPHCRKPQALTEAVASEAGLSAIAPGPHTVFLPRGCPACLGTGYRGRTGLFEVLEIDEPMRTRLLGHRGQPEEGRQTLLADGLRKVLDGVTSLEEVLAVSR